MSSSPLRRRPAPVPSFNGRLCLVTGAASGIGRATALAAARAGARLVLTDRNADALDDVAHELGGSVLARRTLDIADATAVKDFADDVHRAHGSLDVAMDIAGIANRVFVAQLERAARVTSSSFPPARSPEV